MNKLLLILGVLLCFQNDEPVRSWNASYKLSWRDFKGKPKPKHGAAAVTASGITFGFSITETDSKRVVDFTTEVHAHFYPEKSWFIKDLATNHVLGHEQLHFDITEWHARKFRQRISKLKTSNKIKTELRQLHKDINEELASFQNKYDAETDFSRNSEAQLQWKIYIEAELKALEGFELHE